MEDIQIQLVQRNTGILYPYGLENTDVFWPAMIIPESQIDSSLPKISKDEMLLQFFEKKVSVVPKNDSSFVLWNSTVEPFKSFTSKYCNHKTAYIRRAAIFMKSGEIDHSLKWNVWKQICQSTQRKKQYTTSKIIESDLSDWTDATLESL